MRIKAKTAPLFFLLGVLGSGIVGAGQDVEALVKEFFVIPSVTGNEELLAAKIMEMLPKSPAAEVDNLGGVYARAGKGSDALAVLAPLDEFGWFVSGITADGFLRLDRAALLPHPLYDAFLIGHGVVISTPSGLHNGVVAQPAMHLLSRARREELQKGVSLDMVYVDIGAGSEEEVRSRGIEHLDPVTFRPDLVSLAGEKLAGASLGQKAVCSALAAIAAEIAGMKKPPAVQLVWMAQSRFSARGASGRVSLGALRAVKRLQPKTALLLDVLGADQGAGSPVLGKGPVLWKVKEAPSRFEESILFSAQEKNVALQRQVGGESLLLAPFVEAGIDAVVLALPVRFAQTPSEVVSLADVRDIVSLVASVAAKGGVR